MTSVRFRTKWRFFMKICPKCDAQNANTAPVCKHCGANLNETPEIEDATVQDEKPPYHIGLSVFVFISVVTCVLGFVCLKGIFRKKKSLPGLGILAILMSVVCAALVIMDLLSIFLML